MATGGQTHSEVKSVLDRLEVSPSANDDGAPFRSHPSITVTGKRSANAGRYTLSTPESEFQMKRNSGTIPGYTRKFARGARQE